MTTSKPYINLKNFNLMCLDAEQIKRIDKALSEIGDFGEVRLVKEKGKLRFIKKMSSENISSSQDDKAD